LVPLRDIVEFNMLYEQPRLYDALYDQFRDDVDFYVELAQETTGDICELACGTGRVAVPLAQSLSGSGRRVVAVDLSEAMVAAARERASSAGLPADRIEVRIGDMREPAGDGEFGLVIVPLHSLSHLLTTDDLIAALTSIRKSLAPGGRLALALHNPGAAYLASRGDGLERIHEDLASVAVYETASYRSDRQILHLKWYIETAEETSMVEYDLRMIFPEELMLLLGHTGFAVQARYGWYDRTPFGPESASHIVIAAG
jgi:SAM-dependent methyltransferase